MDIRFTPRFHILDALHPEGLDWRCCHLRISTYNAERAFFEARIRRKTGGRREQDLNRCIAFRAQIASLFQDILQHIPEFIDEEGRPEWIADNLVRRGNHGYSNDGSKSPSMTFQGSSTTAQRLLGLSNHQSLSLHVIAAQVAERRNRARKAGPRQ